MSKSLSAMLWALAIIFAALLSREGVIARDSATTLMLVLPLLATMQLSGGLRCRPCQRVASDA